MPRDKIRGVVFSRRKMRIVCISDTHGLHRYINLPDGDVLVHAGDITRNGELDTMEDFAKWMKDQPHRHKLVIFGNHDRFERLDNNRKVAIGFLLDAGITYLQDSSIEIDGVKFYGTPWSPRWGDYQFYADRGNDIAAKWRIIPDDTNVLIVHGPPYEILDGVPYGIWYGEHITINVGCKDLLRRIKELKQLKVFLCGHIHSSSGVKVIDNVVYANCAILNPEHEIAYPARVIDI